MGAARRWGVVLRRGLRIASAWFVLGLLAVPTAAAVDKTFVPASGDWFTAGNWSPVGVPVSTDHVIANGKDVTLTTTGAVAERVTLTGGQIRGPGTLSVGTGASSVDGTQFTLASQTSFAPGSTVSWQGGGMASAGTLVSLGGTTTFATSTSVGIVAGTTLENQGTLNITGDLTFTSNGAGLIRNTATGTINRTTSTGTVTLQAQFENDGDANFESGTTLVRGAGSSSTGTFDVSAGATFKVNSQTLTIGSPGSITSTGTVGTASATLAIGDGATLDAQTVDLAGGSLSVATGATATTTELDAAGATRTGAGTLAVGGGASSIATTSFIGGGTTTFAPGSTVSWSANTVLQSGAPTLVSLRGTTTIATASANTVSVGGTLENQGTLNITADTSFQSNGAGLIRNTASGAINRTAGTGTLSVETPLQNAGLLHLQTGTTTTGTFTQTAGSTGVSAGATLTSNALVLQGGSLGGAGTLGGTITNSGGTLKPGNSPGALTMSGTYTQQAGGTLEVEITGTAPGTDPGHDRITHSGTVNLGGTAQIVLGGGFIPAPAALFTVISAPTVNGTFATVTGPQVAGRSWAGSVTQGTPDGVVLGLGPAPPVPQNSTPPSVTGSPVSGATLTCDPGTWTGAPTTFAFSWLRDGAAIPGQSAATYLVVAADVGATLSCRVVAGNAGGDGPPATSTGLAIPAPPAAPAPIAPNPPPPAPSAATAPVAISKIATLPSPKACVSRRRFPIRLRGVKANRIVRAQIRLNGKQVRNVTGKALGLPIDLRGLPKGRFTVEIVTTDSAGKKLIGKRTYRTCTPKRR
jgi:hypothetical protein